VLGGGDDMPLHHERRGRERECQAQALGAERSIALPPARRAATVTDEEDYARECVRLAGLAADQEIRGQLLNMAREWMAAAMHERHSAVRARRAEGLALALAENHPLTRKRPQPRGALVPRLLADCQQHNKGPALASARPSPCPVGERFL
jgi:hypothetical protein